MSNVIIKILIFLFLVISDLGIASDWKISGKDIPDSVITQLRSKYKEINSPADLQNLIDDLSRAFPEAKIEQKFDGNTWNIVLNQKKIIASITSESIARNINVIIEKGTNKFKGQIFTDNIKKQMKEITYEAMRKLGFPNTKITITDSLPHENFVDISIKIETNRRCIITNVELSFDVPDDYDPDSIVGLTCNETAIQTKTDEITKELKDEGYAFADIIFDGLSYNSDKSKATAKFSGQIGNIVKYKFVDKEGKESKRELFSDVSQSVSPKEFPPYSVRTEVTKLYESDGYNFVKVSDPSIEKEKNIETYTYEIIPGPQIFVTKITVVGNTVFTDKEIIDTLKDYASWGPNSPLVISEISRGISKIKNDYQRRGYWNVNILNPRVSVDPANGKSKLNITIKEGFPRVLTDIKISGNKHLNTDKIISLLPFKVGDNIDRTLLVDFEKELKKLYYDMGYIYTDLDIKAASSKTRNSRRTQLSIKVTEGPQAEVGSVFIFGLVKTKEKVVLRELKFEKGDNYNPLLIAKSKQAILKTGVFRSVSIEPINKVDISKSTQVIDVAITVRESQAGLISFGPGFDYFQGYNYVFEASYKNVSGLARKFSLRAEVSEDRQQEAVKDSTLLGANIGMGFIEPWLFDTPLEGKLSISHKGQATNFWEFTTVAQEGVTYYLSEERISSVTGYIRQKQSIEVGSPDQAALFLSQGDTLISSAGINLQLDLRDDVSWPTKGVFFELDVENANPRLFGDLEYLRTDIITNTYLNIKKLFVFALGLRVTKYFGIERDGAEYGYNTIPTSETLLAGGSELVRGYIEQLGPYMRYFTSDENGDETVKQEEIIGGTSRFIAKFESRFLISDNSAITIFYDTGNAYLDQDELNKYNYRLTNQDAVASNPSIEDNFIFPLGSIITDPSKYFDSVYTSFGVSYNYLTPLGSFRFGYAWPLTQPTSDSCKADPDFCFERRPTGSNIFKKGKIDISIAAKF